MPPGTLWRRAVRRVDRRSAAYRAAPSDHGLALLREACRTANSLFPYRGPLYATPAGIRRAGWRS